MSKFNEKKYLEAIETFVRQSVLMIEEDYPDADREDFELHLNSYIADATVDIDNAIKTLLNKKFGE